MGAVATKVNETATAPWLLRASRRRRSIAATARIVVIPRDESQSSTKMGERKRHAFAITLAAAAIVLVGCQTILGIDPGSRHESDFCAAAHAYDARCNVTDACDVARVDACAKNEAIASPGAITAYTACAELAPCPGADGAGDAGIAYEDCLAAHYGAPSTLLTTVVGSYCAQCGAENVQQCTIGLVAQSLATYDDAILTEIRDTCFAKNAEDGGIGESCANFSRCMNDIVDVVDPPPAACNGS